MKYKTHLDFLTETVKDLERENESNRILEIGTGHFQSARALNTPHNLVITVDNLSEHKKPKDYIRLALGNENIIKIICNSSEINKFLLPCFFDIVYVDGKHDEASCLSDCKIALELVKNDGLIIVDDYNEKAVKIAVGKIIDSYNFELNVIETEEKGNRALAWFKAPIKKLK